MSSQPQLLTLRRFSPSRLFSDRPEESLRLRLLTLLTVTWVALSVLWVTGSVSIPAAAAVLAVVGHWVSWRGQRWLRLTRSIVVAVSAVALIVLARDDLISSLAGDRLPIAEYLLLLLGIFSFALRTRGGLYAQWTLSGVILYFVSERAFDQGFVGFLIVFLGLFLTFFAMAFMEDQLSTARVHWPEGQVGRFWFWLGIVGGGLLVVSALAYAILPPDYRGGAGSRRVGIIPFMGQAGSEDGQPQAFVSRPGPDDQDQGAAVTQVGQTGGTLGAPGGIGVLTTESFEGGRLQPTLATL